MRLLFPIAAGLAVLLAARPAAFAQQASPAPTSPTPATTDAPVRPGPLFKLGTGLTDGAGWGGFSGLTLPLVLGAEQQLAPGWSATVNGTGLWNIGRRRDFHSSKREGLSLQQLSFDAGIRHYYHQEKRRAKGRRTGPYEGPYVALQLNNYFERRILYRSGNYSRYNLAYDYSSLTVQWGMQRRLGGRGMLDAYIGGGLTNPLTYRHYVGSMPEVRRELGIGLELGVKISLASKAR